MAKDGFLTLDDVRALGRIEDERTTDAWERLLLDALSQISLTEAQYTMIADRYATIGEIFETSKVTELQRAQFLPQGSVRSRTVIRPVSGLVDVDAVLWVPERIDPARLYELVRDELEARVRTEQGIEEMNRCVRVLYSGDSPAFHLDVTPAYNDPRNSATDASGKLRVPDLKAISSKIGDGSKPSNPVDFASWVEEVSAIQMPLLKGFTFDLAQVLREKAEVQPLPTHQEINSFDPLRATIKLLKAHRDGYFERLDKADAKPISVVLTTLACKAYERVARRKVAMRPIDVIRAIVTEMPNCFDMSTATERYRLLNPKNTEENFAEKWNTDPALQPAFSRWINQVELDLIMGWVKFDSRVEFVEQFDRAFGPRMKVLAESHVDRALKGLVALGMSTEAMERMNSAALTYVFGLDQDVKTTTQKVARMDRLG